MRNDVVVIFKTNQYIKENITYRKLRMKWIEFIFKVMEEFIPKVNTERKRIIPIKHIIKRISDLLHPYQQKVETKSEYEKWWSEIY